MAEKTEPPTDLPTELATDLATVGANEALDVLEKKQPVPLVFTIGFFGTAPYRPETLEPVALPALREEAKSRECRFLGVYSFAGIFGRQPRESWIDRTGTVGVSMRRQSSKTTGRFEQMMSPFVFETYFEDGTVILTYPKQEPPQNPHDPSERHGGTGFFGKDYEAHLESIRAAASSTRRIVRIESLEEALRLSTFYDSRHAPDAAWFRIGARVLLYGSAAVVAWVLSRFL